MKEWLDYWHHLKYDSNIFTNISTVHGLKNIFFSMGQTQLKKENMDRIVSYEMFDI